MNKVTAADGESCETCRAGCFADREPVGTCRAKRPIAVILPLGMKRLGDEVDTRTVSSWPPVARDNWCLEFTPRVAAAAAAAAE